MANFINRDTKIQLAKQNHEMELEYKRQRVIEFMQRQDVRRTRKQAVV